MDGLVPVPADVLEFGRRHGLEQWAAATYRAGYSDGGRAERLRLQGPPIDLAAQRAGMLAAGISAKTIDELHASPAFDASHRAGSARTGP